MNKEPELKIGQILLAKGYIDDTQISEILTEQKEAYDKFGSVAIKRGFIGHNELLEVLSEIYHLPFVNLSNTAIDEELLNQFPFELLEQHKVLPFQLKEGYLLIATNDPLNVIALQELSYLSGLQVKPVLASLEDLNQALKKCGGSMQTIEALRDINLKDTQDASVVKLVNSIISKAIREGASDLHFELHSSGYRVRFRIDGVLYEKVKIPIQLYRKVVSRIKVISEMDVAESRKPQDGRISFMDGDKEYDIRVSILKDMKGENVVLRILDKEFIFHDLPSLGMDESDVAILNRLIHRPYGMILVTGPTGTGKTTTLYSILSLLNHISKNVITVEDPIEYELGGINQTGISHHSGYNFATAIRHILRHDPDIIMVGEIRDVETAEIAIQSALTGHLVFSTLHTNSAAGAVTRLLDMGIEPFLISSAVTGIIAQRLVRKLCPHCYEEYEPSTELKQKMGKEIELPSKFTLAKAVGCDKCFDTGYAGRIGIFETFRSNENTRKLIIQRANEQAIAQQAVRENMKTLRMAGYHKAIGKLTTIDEVMRVTIVEDD